MPDLPGAAEDAPRLNNNMSETEDVAAVVEHQQPQRKRKRRKAVEQVRGASASFFERLVQRLVEHQESLHRQFLEAMERRERERASRDEAWRRQEADKFAQEAAARGQDRASAAAREAAIIAYLEKLSGESITLPPLPSQEDDDAATNKEQETLLEKTTANKEEMMQLQLSSSSRWPKHEVEALIRVRTGLEGRFQEPGLKGPLWEEVSARMAAAGYPCRSAKRCKEKWENINKYFRKAKESGKKRPSQAKTCPYFDELDRLYSRNSHSTAAANKAATTSSSELLDAVVKYPEGPPPGFAFQDRDQETEDDTNNKEEEEEEEDGGIAGRGRDAAEGQDEDHEKMHFV
jgi:hypothetical protein